MLASLFGRSRSSPQQPPEEKDLLQQRIRQICDEDRHGNHLGSVENKADGKAVVGLVMTTQSSIEEKREAFGFASRWTDLTHATVDRVESILHDEVLPRDWTYFDFKILRKLLKEPSLQTASQIAEAMNAARSDRKSPRYIHWWRYGGPAHEDEYTADEVIRAVKYLDWRLPGLRVKHSRAWTEGEIKGIWLAFDLHEPLATLAKRLNSAGQFTVEKGGLVNFDRLSIEKIIDDKVQVVSQDRLWD